MIDKDNKQIINNENENIEEKIFENNSKNEIKEENNLILNENIDRNENEDIDHNNHNSDENNLIRSKCIQCARSFITSAYRDQHQIKCIEKYQKKLALKSNPTNPPPSPIHVYLEGYYCHIEGCENKIPSTFKEIQQHLKEIHNISTFDFDLTIPEPIHLDLETSPNEHEEKLKKLFDSTNNISESLSVLNRIVDHDKNTEILPTIESLSSPQNQSLDVYPFVCQYTGCGRRFKTLESLESHFLHDVPVSKINPESLPTENEFPCDINECGEIFTTTEALQEHFLVVHKADDHITKSQNNEIITNDVIDSHVDTVTHNSAEINEENHLEEVKDQTENEVSNFDDIEYTPQSQSKSQSQSSTKNITNQNNNNNNNNNNDDNNNNNGKSRRSIQRQRKRLEEYEKNPSEYPFICEVEECDHRFRSDVGLLSHMKDAHREVLEMISKSQSQSTSSSSSKTTPPPSKTTPKTSTSSSSLLQESNTITFECNVCNRKMKSEAGLRDHMKDAHKDIEYIPQSQSKSKSQSQSSTKNITNVDQSNVISQSRLTNKIEQPNNNYPRSNPFSYHCHVCGSSFRTDTGLISHIEFDHPTVGYHPTRSSNTYENPKQYICSWCHRSYIKAEDCDRHMQTCISRPMARVD